MKGLNLNGKDILGKRRKKEESWGLSILPKTILTTRKFTGYSEGMKNIMAGKFGTRLMNLSPISLKLKAMILKNSLKMKLY